MSCMDTAMKSLMERSPFLRSHATLHLETDSHVLHYLLAGSGKPLILVHGGGMWLYSFRHIITPLSRSFMTCAPDMPGYGYTLIRDSRSPMGIRDMVAVLKELMAGLGMEKASFVGHSWGGGWVLAFAMAFPDMVDRIVLIDSSGLDVPDVLEWELLKVPVLGEVFLKSLTRGMVRRRLMRSFHDTSLVDEDMVTEVFLPLRVPSNRRVQLTLSRNLSWKEVSRGLPSLMHETMLVWGARDRYLDVSLTGRFQEKMQGLRVEILEGCGHSPHEEMPGKVLSLICDFLASG